MDQSILNTVKKSLGIEPEYKAFDSDITIHINSVFFTLNQLGVGPIDGFNIEDDTANWGLFIDPVDKNLSVVKSYMYLRVRLLFDPPATSFAIDSMKKQAEEIEWRLSVYTDSRKLLIVDSDTV